MKVLRELRIEGLRRVLDRLGYSSSMEPENLLIRTV